MNPKDSINLLSIAFVSRDAWMKPGLNSSQPLTIRHENCGAFVLTYLEGSHRRPGCVAGGPA
jgi:hypothetical protein